MKFAGLSPGTTTRQDGWRSPDTHAFDDRPDSAARLGLAWGGALFLVAAAWRWGGLKRVDAPFFTLAAVLLLAGCWIVGRGDVKRDVFFWTGLLFLAYLAVQWWNAGRTLQYDAGAGRWFHTPPPVPRLPWAFDRREAAQMLYWFFPAWVIGLCMRSSAIARRSLGPILRGLVVSAGVLVLAGAFQRLSGLPIWRMPANAIYFASFGYSNHAAAYFLLLAGVGFGLSFRQAFRQDRPARGMELAGLAAATALCLAGAALSISRAGLILAIAMTVFAVGYGGRRAWRHLRPTARVHWALAVALAMVSLYFAVASAGGSAIEAKFTPRRRPAYQAIPGVDHINLDLSDRPRLWGVAWRALKVHPVYGSGGWGFRHVAAFHLSPEYWDYLRFNPGRANVHCDPLQFLVEFGLVGGGLLALAVAALAMPLFRRGSIHGAFFSMTSAGLLSVLLLSLIDLPFRCPAVVWTWTAVLAALPGLMARGPSAASAPAPSKRPQRNPHDGQRTRH